MYLEARELGLRRGNAAAGHSCDVHAIRLGQASTCLADATIANDAHPPSPAASAECVSVRSLKKARQQGRMRADTGECTWQVLP